MRSSLNTIRRIDGIGADASQRRLDLGAHQFRRHGMDDMNAVAILDGHGRHGGLGIDTIGLGGLEIGLNSGAPARA